MNVTSIVNSTVSAGSATSSSNVNSTVTAPTTQTIDGNYGHSSNEPSSSVLDPTPEEGSDEEVDQELDEDFDDESDGRTPVPNLDDAFRASYADFKNDLKWQLPGGSTVEDILYQAYWNKNLRPSVRCSIRNWVVDLGSEKMQALFSESEWAAIKAEAPPMPAADDKFARSLLRFSKVTTIADLRHALENTSYKPTDVPYTKAEHFDPEWAERVIRQFPVLYEHDEEPLREKHLEDWYSYNVWSDIIDKCFLSLPHVALERREIICQSSAIRKNRQRTEPSSRMKSGPRLDGIVRSVDDDAHEFCAIESAPSLRGGTSSTKWLNDKAKLGKVLRDMLGRLITLADHDSRIVKSLQVVGISTAGLTMQVSRMCHRKGYVCLLMREKLRRVPHDVKQFQELLFFLVAFIQAKGVLAASITAFRGRLQGSLEHDDESFVQKLLGVSQMSNVATNIATLPRAADSP